MDGYCKFPNGHRPSVGDEIKIRLDTIPNEFDRFGPSKNILSFERGGAGLGSMLQLEKLVSISSGMMLKPLKLNGERIKSQDEAFIVAIDGSKGNSFIYNRSEGVIFPFESVQLSAKLNHSNPLTMLDAVKRVGTSKYLLDLPNLREGSLFQITGYREMPRR